MWRHGRCRTRVEACWSGALVTIRCMTSRLIGFWVPSSEPGACVFVCTRAGARWCMRALVCPCCAEDVCVCVCVCGRVRVGVCVYAQGPLSVLPVDIAFWKCVCAHVHTLHHACMHETACHACMCFHVYGQRLRQTPESASACAAYVTLAYQAAARHLWLPSRVRLTQRTFCCPDILFFFLFSFSCVCQVRCTVPRH